jgi:hypothetical protein
MKKEVKENNSGNERKEVEFALMKAKEELKMEKEMYEQD